MSTAPQYIPQTVPAEIHSPRIVLVWLLVVGTAWTIIGGVVGAPYLLSHGHVWAALITYQAFSHVCHQMAERSFFFDGYPLAVCARCLGLYVGFAVAVTGYPLFRSLSKARTPARIWLFAGASPTIIDFSLGFFGIWSNTHSSRFLTGVICGAVSAFFVLPGLVDLSQMGVKSVFSMKNNAPLESNGGIRSDDRGAVQTVPRD
jgi:uncharacterized membrane protein